MITIVDYGLGNLGSIKNMLKYIDVKCEIQSCPESLQHAKKIILPGVGKFDAGISGINKKGLKEILNYKAIRSKFPFLESV